MPNTAYGESKGSARGEPRPSRQGFPVGCPPTPTVLLLGHMPLKPRLQTRRAATPELLAMVAGRFRALSEPARLAILHALEDGPLTVTELVKRTGLGQGNLSKHLQQLHAAGFLSRTRKGLFVHYALADDDVLALCEIMCGRLETDLSVARETVANRRGA